LNSVVLAREEVASALTHGVGLVASVAGGAALITVAAFTRDVWQIVAACIYVASLVTLYAASTAFHAARSPVARNRLQIVDHCAIYGLIAGSYTPFTLGLMRGGWGWTLFGVVWGLAGLGMLLKLFFTDRLRLLSTTCYLALGWMALIAFGPLNDAITFEGMVWIVAGGVAYSAGTIIYHHDRLPYGHAVWHLFVIAGSACHFVAVLSQMLPLLPA
jgi:hemolysin III